MALVLLGALAGGLVNGLTGFGTGITAMGLWLHALPPAVVASLVVVCSVIAQLQSLPVIRRDIEWRRLLPFLLPGLLGVPLGTWLLPRIEPGAFKAGVGVFLIAYAAYALLRGAARRAPPEGAFGGRIADGAVGFGGGILGGMAGVSGVLPVVWADVRGWSKARRRSLVQGFNLAVLSAALAAHATSGLLTAEVGWATLAALPGTLGGAWAGAMIYRRLGDRGYQRVVMLLLLVSGVMLVLVGGGG